MFTTSTALQGEIPRIAVIGCGYWGENLIRNFSELGALAGVCDSDRDRMSDAATRYATKSLEMGELLNDEAIPGVVISAPASQHHVLAREALLAGKHVLVEKPLALHLHEAQELCKLAADLDLILMVGHLMQYHPAFQTLRSLVAAGDLGRIQYVYSTRLNLGRFRREENILWSFAPHDISMILQLVGSEPTQVVAHGASYLHKEIADVTTTHLAFPGGERAHVFVSWLHPFKEQKLVVVGEEGMAVFDDGLPWTDKLRLFPHGIDWTSGIPEPSRAESEAVALASAEPLRIECRHFLECIASGATPLTDGEEGLRVLRVLETAEHSMSSEGVR